MTLLYGTNPGPIIGLVTDALSMSMEQRVAPAMHRAAFIEAMREAKQRW